MGSYELISRANARSKGTGADHALMGRALEAGEFRGDPLPANENSFDYLVGRGP